MQKSVMACSVLASLWSTTGQAQDIQSYDVYRLNTVLNILYMKNLPEEGIADKQLKLNDKRLANTYQALIQDDYNFVCGSVAHMEEPTLTPIGEQLNVTCVEGFTYIVTRRPIGANGIRLGLDTVKIHWFVTPAKAN